MANKNEEVTRSVLLLQSAEARRKAIQLADQGHYGEAAKRLRDSAGAIRQSGLTDNALDEEHDALLTQAKNMDRGAAFYQSYSRKSMSTQAYFTSRGAHEDTQALRLREQQRLGEAPENSDATGQPDTGDIEDHITGFFDKPLPAGPIHVPPTQLNNQTQKIPTLMRWREQVFLLDRDLIRIGRAPQNEIVMNTSGISRFHAQIKRENGEWILQDLGSTNGTHVGGQPLEKPHALRHGDIVYLCDQRVMFEA